MNTTLTQVTKAIDWQVRYFKAQLTKGEIIAEIAEDKEIIANYSTVHKYTSELFKISEQQSRDELKAYNSIAHLLNYTNTPEEALRIQTVPSSYLAKIPNDTDPRVAIEALMTSSTRNEVKENLRLAKTGLDETEAKLKEEVADRANKEKLRVQLMLDERAKKKARQLEQTRLEEESNNRLIDWIKADPKNEAEHTKQRSGKEIGSICLDEVIYSIDNDLYVEHKERTHYEWEANYSGVTFDTLTEAECKQIQILDDKIYNLKIQAENIFINYTVM